MKRLLAVTVRTKIMGTVLLVSTLVLVVASVVSYYTSVRNQAPHARDGCTAQTLPAGVYTFTVTPSTSGAVSAPASGEVLFEVTLSP